MNRKIPLSRMTRCTRACTAFLQDKLSQEVNPVMLPPKKPTAEPTWVERDEEYSNVSYESLLPGTRVTRCTSWRAGSWTRARAWLVVGAPHAKPQQREPIVFYGGYPGHCRRFSRICSACAVGGWVVVGRGILVMSKHPSLLPYCLDGMEFQTVLVQSMSWEGGLLVMIALESATPGPMKSLSLADCGLATLSPCASRGIP